MTAIDATSAFADSHGGTFINKEEKALVFNDQDAMYVYHAEPASDGMYGLQTIFHVKAKRWGKDETKLLAFAHNEQRERLAKNILTLLATGEGSYVGPVYLHKFVSKTGNEGWELKPVPYEGTKTPPKVIATATASTPAPASSAPAATDDDLPF